ncbi:MAG: DMT family transporter [Bdellovibrionota bacterium]
MNNYKNIFQLVSIPVLVALSWILGKVLIIDLDPATLSSTRLLLSGSILLFFSNLTKQLLPMSYKERTKLLSIQILLSTIGRVTYFWLGTYALVTISSSEALIIMGLVPVFVLILEFLFKVNQLSTKKTLLILSTCILSLTAITKESTSNSSYSDLSIGHLAALGAAVSFALYLVLQKRFINKSPPSNTLVIQFLFAGFVLFLIANSPIQKIINLNGVQLVRLITYSAICSLLPHFFLQRSLATFHSSTVSSVISFTPVIGIILTTIFEKKQINFSFLLLTLLACACCAILLLSIRPKKESC